MSADPYRSPAEVQNDLTRHRVVHPRVGNGTRDCPKPGAFARWWHGLQFEDTWTCDCGQEWEWHRGSTGTYDCWRRVKK